MKTNEKEEKGASQDYIPFTLTQPFIHSSSGSHKSSSHKLLTSALRSTFLLSEASVGIG